MTTTVSYVISHKTLTVTLAKSEPACPSGQLWWTLSSDDTAVLPPMDIAPDFALADDVAARALASHYLAASDVLPATDEQLVLPWRPFGHTADGAQAWRVTLTAMVTAT